MKFLPKDKVSKTIVVLSDLHLGAGPVVWNRRNFLEDFHYDKEFASFLEYYSTGVFKNREVELIINGDFFDLLSVPFVKFFDDEFWSEKAAIEKLKLVLSAHPEVLAALVKFAGVNKKKIVYIIGNHDAEFVFESLQKIFMDIFPKELQENVQIFLTEGGEYQPIKQVMIKHGHQYDHACQFSPKECVVKDEKKGDSYFIPSWGSYFVTRIINKFKKDRPFIHSVRPIRKFIIYGFIYDTLFTIRFLIANLFYFFMVRFIYYFKQSKNLKAVYAHLSEEMRLMKDYETLAQEYLDSRDDIKVLIMGHTHLPLNRTFIDGSIFINTGTWTKMYNMDFGKSSEDFSLTYAQIDVCNPDEKFFRDDELCRNNIQISLLSWRGMNQYPFYEYQ